MRDFKNVKVILLRELMDLAGRVCKVPFAMGGNFEGSGGRRWLGLYSMGAHPRPKRRKNGIFHVIITKMGFKFGSF